MPAPDEVADLKAKITKLKRQALNFKNKLGEAVAARGAAMAELQALKEVGQSLDFLPCRTEGRKGAVCAHSPLVRAHEVTVCYSAPIW